MPDSTELERLRASFAALEVSGGGEIEPLDAERVWLAARGELPADEVRELVERLLVNPETAEAWRLAVELGRRADEGVTANVVPFPANRRWRWAAGLAAAAVVVLGVSLPLLRHTPAADEQRYRGSGPTPVVSLLDASQPLPRDAFLLRWSEGSPGCRYDLEVVTERLDPILRAGKLERAEQLVPQAALDGVPTGSKLLWRVDVVAPDGSVLGSSRFVAVVGESRPGAAGRGGL